MPEPAPPVAVATEDAITTMRKATLKDVPTLYQLINSFAKKDLMLPRSMNELYETIRDFTVICDENNAVVACCALHIDWDDLAELKSLAVDPAYQGKHLGTKLVENALVEAKELGIRQVFALTYKLNFFKRIDFAEIDKNKLPHKVWGECINCPKFTNCDEKALIRVIE